MTTLERDTLQTEIDDLNKALDVADEEREGIDAQTVRWLNENEPASRVERVKLCVNDAIKSGRRSSDLSAGLEQFKAAAKERDALLTQAREALKWLVLDIGGAWSAFEHTLRQDLGNTNYILINERIRSAEVALAKLEGFAP